MCYWVKVGYAVHCFFAIFCCGIRRNSLPRARRARAARPGPASRAADTGVLVAAAIVHVWGNGFKKDPSSRHTLARSPEVRDRVRGRRCAVYSAVVLVHTAEKNHLDDDAFHA